MSNITQSAESISTAWPVASPRLFFSGLFVLVLLFLWLICCFVLRFCWCIHLFKFILFLCSLPQMARQQPISWSCFFQKTLIGVDLPSCFFDVPKALTKDTKCYADRIHVWCVRTPSNMYRSKTQSKDMYIFTEPTFSKLLENISWYVLAMSYFHEPSIFASNKRARFLPYTR